MSKVPSAAGVTILEAGPPVEEDQEYDPWHPDVYKGLGFGKKPVLQTTELTYVPQTNEHLKALEFMQEGMKLRNVPRNQFGQPKVDCSCIYEQMCQICDGRLGPWVFNNNKGDLRFHQYRKDILRNKVDTMGEFQSANAAPNPTKKTWYKNGGGEIK